LHLVLNTVLQAVLFILNKNALISKQIFAWWSYQSTQRKVAGGNQFSELPGCEKGLDIAVVNFYFRYPTHSLQGPEP